VGNKALTWTVNALYLKHLTDILTCYKVMRATIVPGLGLRCDGFDIDGEITSRLLRQHQRIVEVPITYDPRSVDEGKKLGRRAGWSVLVAIIRVRVGRRSKT
jgi:hypothetical protein